MKLLHCSDWHVGVARSYPDYLGRSKAAFNELLQLASTCDTVVFCGDFFDTPNPKHAERALVADFFAKCPCPIVGITGNHDRFSKHHWEDTCANWLVQLAAPHHRVWDRPTSQAFGGVWWLALPNYPYTQLELQLVTDWLVAQIPTSWDRPIVLISHQFYRHAVLDNGYVGPDTNLQLYLPPCVTYAALGDIHRHQSLEPHAWYSGSLFQTNFGEQLPKGVLVVDLETPTDPLFVPCITPKPLVELDRVPAQLPDAYIHLKVPADDVPIPTPQLVVKLTYPTHTNSVNEPIKSVHTLMDYQQALRQLRDFLAKRKLPQHQQKLGMRFAKQLIEEMQNEET